MSKNDDLTQYAELKKQYLEANALLPKLVEKHKKIQGKASEYEVELYEAKRELDAARQTLIEKEKDFICEDITKDELSKTRAVVENLDAKVAEAENNCTIVKRSLPQIRKDIQATGETLNTSKRRFAKVVIDQLFKDIQSDAKLNEKLLEINAALRFGGIQQTHQQMVEVLFKTPAFDDVRESVNEFMTKHEL